MRRIRALSAIVCLLWLPAAPVMADGAILREIADLAIPVMWLNSGAPGLVVALVSGDDSLVAGAGETARGNGQEPDGRSLVRLGSISKVLATDLLARLVVAGKLRLSDKLQQYAPSGIAVPAAAGQEITLLDLATHSAGLPREIGPIPTEPPTLTWPTKAQRWAFLADYKLPWAPGTVAAYSNVSFQLLGDALVAAAGQDYPTLFNQFIAEPLAMTDTGTHPTPQQCARLMTGTGIGGAAPCIDTGATEASGGVYSTADDMAKWLRQLVHPAPGDRSAVALTQAVYRQRQEMPAAIGFDEAGPMAGLGLGWVVEAAQGHLPMIVQKTGGGGGFMSYVAFAPGRGVGIFVSVNRIDFAMFSAVTSSANAILGELATR